MTETVIIKADVSWLMKGCGTLKKQENDNVLISESNQHIKISIRNNNSVPSIAVNDYPLSDKEPLRDLLLVEAYGIKYYERIIRKFIWFASYKWCDNSTNT